MLFRIPEGPALDLAPLSLYVTKIPEPTDHQIFIAIYTDDTVIVTISSCLEPISGLNPEILWHMWFAVAKKRKNSRMRQLYSNLSNHTLYSKASAMSYKRNIRAIDSKLHMFYTKVSVIDVKSSK